MSRLRSYARLPRESQKVKDGAEAFREVYAEVDARSEGRCEWTDTGGTYKGEPINSARCRKRATDHHHTVKPRRSPLSHRAEYIIALCREHHDRCEWPFARGRGVVSPLGRGRFLCAILFAASKFQARGQGE